jgi:FeS assembly SUF system regulator
MLKISRLADYATVLMSALGQSQGAPMPTKMLAENTSINIPTVRKVMRLLLDAHLVSSLQGVTGGYSLIRPSDQISIVDIIAAIDGMPAMTECAKASPGCHHIMHCNLSGNWQRINAVVQSVLQKVSLADMLTPNELPLTFYERTKNND